MKIETTILMLGIFLFACDPVQNLEVINKSGDTIFFELSYNNEFDKYPIQKTVSGDTLWENMNYTTPKGKVQLPLIGQDAWRKVIIEKSVDSTLTVFIFEKALLRAVRPDSLLKAQLHTRKFTLNVKDLEQRNWKIVYDE